MHIQDYEVILFDLDGVIYEGPHAIAHAVDTLNTLHSMGKELGFVTNNASRSPEEVAAHLNRLGLHVRADHVFGSAWAAAGLLARTVDAPSQVLIVGSDYLANEVEQRGFEAVRAAQLRSGEISRESIAAVVQGFDRSVGWEDLAQAAYTIEQGATWIATNVDMTIPQAEGIAPGNGSLVQAIAQACSQEPLVAGKPQPTLFQDALHQLGGTRALMVGDRLDTDILGGNRAGLDTALVLTGIDTAEAAEQAAPDSRPTYVLQHLRALVDEVPEQRVAEHV